MQTPRVVPMRHGSTHGGVSKAEYERRVADKARKASRKASRRAKAALAAEAEARWHASLEAGYHVAGRRVTR